MKDIDFDELDKAVNSLMGGVKGASDRPDPKTLTIATTLKPDEKPHYENIKQAAQRIGGETLGSPVQTTHDITTPGEEGLRTLELKSTVEQVAHLVNSSIPTPSTQKPTGRFMDVIHPSSDMKTAPAGPVQPEVVVPPVLAEVAPTITVNEELASVELPEVKPETTDLDVETTNVASALPDLIEEVVPQTATTNDETPKEEVVVPTSTSEPQSSPFLADAKVEKRPLGGDPTQNPNDDSEFEPLVPQDISSDTQLNPTPSSDLPDELHGDLLAIETNLANAESEELSSSTSTPDIITPLVPQSSTGSGSTDTALQSKISSSTIAAPEAGAIYDTSEYHKPIAHPAKSKSGWIWIVLILIIVAICGAGAAAYYMLMTK